MTVGSGELAIIGSQALGELGPHEGPATLLPWHWYYQLPTMAFWAFAIVPLVLFKENRRGRAWAIFIPLLVVVLVCGLFSNLCSALSPASTAGGLPGFVVTMATAWSIVWLVAQRLVTRSWIFTCLLVLLVMSAVGLLSSACNFEISDWASAIGPGVYFLLIACSFVLPMALSGRLCRKTYSPGRFMAWLLLWTVLAPSLGMTILIGGISLCMAATVGQAGMLHLLIILPWVALMSCAWGFLLYLLNLPFMFLAFYNSFYRRRFCYVFGLVEAGSPFAAHVPDDKTGAGLHPKPHPEGEAT